MKPLLLSLAAVAIAAAGCTPRGREAAYGTPYTDITRISTEPGAYAKATPYRIIDERQSGQSLVIDVNVAYSGDINTVGKQVVKDRKGHATAVTVHVYEWDQTPPHQPWNTVEWTEGGGFKMLARKG